MSFLSDPKISPRLVEALAALAVDLARCNWELHGSKANPTYYLPEAWNLMRKAADLIREKTVLDRILVREKNDRT